ncbi:MAG: dihydroorotate dehydrogenase [Spirochaetes bacterium]|nr:dihydroorotate dehydrogenase [Spirochaetota bacterium]
MNPLEVKLGTLKLRTPIVLASGTAGYGEISTFFNIKNLGALTLKAVSIRKRDGNLPPRIAETPSGIMNAIGLANEGIDYFEKHIVPKLSRLKTTLIANVVGDSVEEYALICRKLNRHKIISAIELNVSCPNVKGKKKLFCEDPDVLSAMVSSCKKASSKPIIVKLPPAVFGIEEMAERVEKAGADMLSLVNTVPAMEIDIMKERPVLGNNVGGLSGPAIRPIALRLVHRASQAVKIPIIGGGGVADAADVIKFILAGATAVSVGTSSMIRPDLTDRLAEDLIAILKRKGVDDIAALRGRLSFNGV